MDLAKPVDSTIKMDLGLELWLFERRIAARLGYSLEAAVTVDFDSEGLPIPSTAKFAINPGVRRIPAPMTIPTVTANPSRTRKILWSSPGGFFAGSASDRTFTEDRPERRVGGPASE